MPLSPEIVSAHCEYMSKITMPVFLSGRVP
jgi:hypothetical protein